MGSVVGVEPRLRTGRFGVIIPSGAADFFFVISGFHRCE